MPQLDAVVARPHANEQELAHILSAIQGIRFGSLEIIIHDSRIVQIDRKEKFRFERDR
jgi:hypothetical protein